MHVVKCPECETEHSVYDLELADSDRRVYRRTHDFAGTISGYCKLPNAKTLTFPCGHSILTVQ